MSLPRKCSGTPNWWRLHGNNVGLVSLLFSSDRLQIRHGIYFFYRDMFIMAGSFTVKERGAMIHV